MWMLLLLSTLSWLAIHRYIDQQRTHYQTLVNNDYRLIQESKDLLYLVESVTMSARLYASNGEAVWKQRHAKHAQRIDQVLANIKQYELHALDQVGVSWLEQSKNQLFELEQRAIQLVDQQHLGEAYQLLGSERYRQLEQQYRRAVDEYLHHLEEVQSQLHGRGEDALLAQDIELFLIYLGLLVVSWVVTARLLSRASRRLHESKDEFLATMSHELRTPLATIIGNLEHLLRSQWVRGVEAEKGGLVEVLESSHRAATRQLYLVNDLLDMSKIGSGKFSVVMHPYDFAELVREVAEIFQLRAEKQGIALSLEGALPATHLMGDATRISQILINLLSNALKFTSEGAVTLRIGIRDEQIEIQVEDSGIGISAEDQQRMFGRFEQAEKKFDPALVRSSGSGLGLYISQQLAKRMGGGLSVESRLGVGSIFTLTLPYQPTEEAVGLGDIQPQVDQQPAIRNYAGAVLIAEDDYELQLVERRILEETGLTVSIAANGREAVTLATRNRYDLILMDLNMPEMDGISATRSLRAQGIEIPIVALTANVLDQHREQFAAVGGVDFLTKPIEQPRLHAILQRIFGEGEGDVASPVVDESGHEDEVEATTETAADPSMAGETQQDHEILDWTGKMVHDCGNFLQATNSYLHDLDKGRQQLEQVATLLQQEQQKIDSGEESQVSPGQIANMLSIYNRTYHEERLTQRRQKGDEATEGLLAFRAAFKAWRSKLKRNS